MEPYRVEDADGGGAAIEIGDCSHAVQGHAHLVVDSGDGEALGACLAASDLRDVCVAMHLRAGQPVPVITPRPVLMEGKPVQVGPFIMLATPDGRVQLGVDAGASRLVAPSIARQLAGFLVAVADMADAQPDPADVERLTAAIEAAHRELGGSVVHMEDVARHLLRSGKVTLTREDRSDD